jgi:hypothetical protein
VRIRERVAKLERFTAPHERRPDAVVIYRGHLCCADLRACAAAGHVEIVRGDLDAPVLVLLPDNGRDG